MNDIRLVKTRLHAGIWEGELHVPDDARALPDLEVTHLDQPVSGHVLDEDPERAGVWFFRVALPAELISDGVQVFVISNRDTGAKLAHFSIIAGEALADDMRAEMALLRAELDMLKRAFRRHCVDTGAN
ncbi:hypothetical protein [Pacificibacter marinus]|uniref:Uncharacterized protein n=1 Tax=Pacificibacter marinus TaxID=658057 RepID=A0A1Y5S309_9RHOB|nr:hypothetical protein [Pacificibacter marinus]SEK91833.1 hypothetical protein SAMN04488032_108105 [Pacificibacter marinus]SLN31472.1 hypothetical protein PAM7971_01203 [Pacificibacter marinus]